MARLSVRIGICTGLLALTIAVRPALAQGQAAAPAGAPATRLSALAPANLAKPRA